MARSRLTLEQAAKLIIRDGNIAPTYPQADGIQDCIGIVSELKRGTPNPGYLFAEVQRMMANLQMDYSKENVNKLIDLLHQTYPVTKNQSG